MRRQYGRPDRTEIRGGMNAAGLPEKLKTGVLSDEETENHL